ncbi:MAG: hypothetical protein ACYTF9_05765 [Planctomycetota bacterium]
MAISQEDRDLEQAKQFLVHFEDDRPFEIVFDLERAKTTRFDRTTTYLIDERGVVRQVFPNLIRHRAAWGTVLEEVKKLAR